MRISLLIIFLVSFSFIAPGQNLIGYHAKGIKAYINKNNPELTQERNFKNDHYKYLKFTDGDLNHKTFIFFLSDKNRCIGVRMIYDLSMKKRIISELDSLYVRKAENHWSDAGRKKKASVELTTEDWFLTVSIKPLKIY